MDKILVFGTNGQVAQALRRQLPSEALFVPREEADFNSPNSICSLLDKVNPTVVINAVAYTAVDKAESEKDIAMLVNAHTPSIIADWCHKHTALFIHISTDYVYAGDGSEPQLENSLLAPKNFYGESKLLGEQKIQASGADYIILRTSWVYYEAGRNFVKTMLQLGKDKSELRVVADQIGSPTYAGDIADAVIKIVHSAKKPVAGIYNICGKGFTSWHAFAQEIFRVAKSLSIPLSVQNVLPISSSEYKTPAARPLNSRMSTEKIKRDFDVELPPWQVSLRHCIENMVKNENSAP